MATKPIKAVGRSLADFGTLKPAEKKLLVACRKGEVAVIGTSKRPEKKTSENTIRPGFLRFLVQGGDERAPVHEQGVQLIGAWVEGDIDLEGCSSDRTLFFVGCRINGALTVRDGKFKGLLLDGSLISGLVGDRVKVEGSIHLRDGFTATDVVRLAGAQIDGDLDCAKGRFESEADYALSCDGAIIGGDVFLRDGFFAAGPVRLLGVRIGGVLNCRDGHFHSKTRAALSCDRAVVGGTLVLRRMFDVNGIISLSSARANQLIDDASAMKHRYNLNGFRYERLVGSAPTDSTSRIAWLKNQPLNHASKDFRPQPWEQLIRVLRDMGHGVAADEVAIAKQDALRAAGKFTGPGHLLHLIYGFLAGYGYRPLKTITAMFFVLLACASVYHVASERGRMGPTSPIIQTDEAIYSRCRVSDELRVTNWIKCGSLPQEYTTFSAFFYSLDLILPLVDLQQDKDWAPIVMESDGVTSMWQGQLVRYVVWFEILFGWVASLLLVAVLGNLVKKD